SVTPADTACEPGAGAAFGSWMHRQLRAVDRRIGLRRRGVEFLVGWPRSVPRGRRARDAEAPNELPFLAVAPQFRLEADGLSDQVRIAAAAHWPTLDRNQRRSARARSRSHLRARPDALLEGRVRRDDGDVVLRVEQRRERAVTRPVLDVPHRADRVDEERL